MINWKRKLRDFDYLTFDEPMADKTTYGVGGSAAVFATPNSDDESLRLIEYLCQHKLPYFILGNGSNILISDKGFPGVVIKLGPKYKDIKINGNIVTSGASALLWDLVRKTAAAGLTGMEELAGIPGTVGGGLHMNASAYGNSISDQLVRIRAIDKKNCQMHWHDQGAIRFEYRKSPNRLIYLWAEFLLQTNGKEACLEKIDEINRKRAAAQPLDKKSAGCVFKNPEGDHAGRIIDEIGLKGLSYAGAEVSSRHANFIINNGDATAEEIWTLVKMVMKTVKRYKNIKLKPEIILKGEFDGKMHY